MVYLVFLHIDTYRIRIPGNSQNIFKRFKIIYICTYVRNLNFKVLMVQKYFLAIYIIISAKLIQMMLLILRVHKLYEWITENNMSKS